MRFRLEGVFPAMVTPFTKNGEQVDYDRAAALATRLAGQGVQGLFVAGTTGEGPLMTLSERKQLLETVVAAVGKRVKVLAHAGCFDTASTVELAKHARDSGAAAVGVVAPGFYGYDDVALKKHYTVVARAVKGFPVMLYNLPSCAKNVLHPSLVLDLARTVDNIVGLKDSAGNMAALGDVLAGAPKGFNVINGVDEYTYQAYLSGASGSVSSTANVFPELFLSIRENVEKGRLKKAWDAQVTLSAACAGFQYGARVAFYKEALRIRGFDPGYVRPPQREPTASESKRLAEALGLR